MNKNSFLDYLASKIFSMLGVIFLFIPPGSYVWLGKMAGRMLFYLDKKHRDISYRNIRFVFCGQKSPGELKRITRMSFESLGMNLFEAIALKRVNKAYIDKYIEIENKHLVDEELAKKRGLIFVTLHLGNWEISNAACGLIYSSCNVVVKKQKHSRLNHLLNLGRRRFGVKILDSDAVRDIIRVLENNQILSIVSDHGAGNNDLLVDFFGRPASMPPGAARLALKFKTPVLFAYIVRKRGPYHKITLERFNDFADTADKENDLIENLKRINIRFEKYIRKYPEQYLWSYKRWKHSRERSVLILSDGKTGHLRQSQAVAKAIENLGFGVKTKVVEIRFKNGLSRVLLYFCASLLPFLGRVTFLKYILTKDCYTQMLVNFSDIIISCGVSLAGVNIIASFENKAKAIHILRLGPIPFGRFNLLVIPRHDRPPRRENVVVTDGALNLIDARYLKEQAEKLVSSIKCQVSSNYIGFLAGGDTKDFYLDEGAILEAARQIKSSAANFNAHILVTTSRRTPKKIEDVLKNELSGSPNCKLLVVANERNIPEAVGGILGLSSIVIVTPESVSMISEAVSSGKYVIVLEIGDIGARHRKFVDNLQAEGYIYVVSPGALGGKIKYLLDKKPAIKVLKDGEIVAARLKEIL